MKTKADTLKLWKNTYYKWSKAVLAGQKTEAVKYSAMLTAYENVLEMSSKTIIKKIKIV